MKKHFLSLGLACLFGGAAYAANVSGTVTSTTTCAPVAGAMVYLQDSTFAVVDSTLTGSSGTYSMNFPTSWPAMPFIIKVNSCSSSWTTAGKYVGGNEIVNQVVCGPYKLLNCIVKLGSVQNSGYARAYLIQVRRNYPTVGDTTLTAVDSVTLTNNAYAGFKRACAPSDTFLVKAMLMPSHPAYKNWLPSYDSSLTWSTARRYTGADFNGMPHYLQMFPGINPGGPGFIGGSVLAGANKQTSVGDPLKSRLLMLINANTKAPVAFTYSDATGQFSFSNIATGTYQIVGDAWGLYNVPLTVTVSNARLIVDNIIFEEHYIKNTFEGRFASTAVNTVSGPLTDVRVYPNPVNSVVSLTGLDQVKGTKKVSIRNIVGAEVMSQEFAEGQRVELAVEALPVGTYVLQLSTFVGTASFKMIR